MIKNKVKLEHIVADKVYQLVLDNDSPTVYIKEALVKFMDYVNSVEEEARKKLEASQPPVAPVEPPVAYVAVEQPKAPDGSVV